MKQDFKYCACFNMLHKPYALFPLLYFKSIFNIDYKLKVFVTHQSNCCFRFVNCTERRIFRMNHGNHHLKKVQGIYVRHPSTNLKEGHSSNLLYQCIAEKYILGIYLQNQKENWWSVSIFLSNGALKLTFST